MDYKETLNLPSTDFPMKANLKKKEVEILSFWEKSSIYEKMLKKRKGREKFILHDGPPYANGPIHIGHSLNKILKDIIIKYKTLRGFYSPFIPGWDCHGLPVEHQLFKELGKDKSEVEILDFRERAYRYALKFVDVQRKEFKRLGVFARWDRPYLTLTPHYESRVLEALGELVRRGYIYRGLKPVNWCKNCRTALAEAEVEYEMRHSPSIYVKFKVKELKTLERRDLSSKKLPARDIYFVIWTTTPWTLLANVAIALHPQELYCFLLAGDQIWIIAQKLKSQFIKITGKKEEDFDFIFSLPGKGLEGSIYEHPFFLREGRIVLADYVSMEEGTGCVHTAPGHGEEDFLTAQKYALPTLMPVDESGSFDSSVGEWQGMDVGVADKKIIERLKEKDLLVYEDKIEHSYPHCWRCKGPLIFRATPQFFLNIEHNSLREHLKSAIESVDWHPFRGKERISSMIDSRPDWCLSRQRLWGVPIPSFICENCHNFIIEPDVIFHIAKIVQEEGSNAYFKKNEVDLLPPDYKCPQCGRKNFKKQEDILDVWFESGVSFYAVVTQDKDLQFPVDLYLEGSDQHRGWFQVSLIPSVSIFGRSPYKQVLTHGFVVDEKGCKMSKSLGNVISPQEIMASYGAEILRLWASSSDYRQDIKISDGIIRRLIDAYRKIRNTFRFLLGNLYDFRVPQSLLEYERLLEIDRWILANLYELERKILEFYENFSFHKIYQEIYRFSIVDLSNLYFDILKDRLYTFKKDSLERRSAQTALYYLLKTFIKVLSPILSFTMEEVFFHLKKLGFEEEESVFLCEWYGLPEKFKNEELINKYKELISLREEVMKSLEEKRQEGIIGSSLEAKINLYLPLEDFQFLCKIKTPLEWIFIVSSVKLIESRKKKIVVEKAKGKKCNRCWNYSLSVGGDSSFPDICQRCIKVLKEI